MTEKEGGGCGEVLCSFAGDVGQYLREGSRFICGFSLSDTELYSEFPDRSRVTAPLRCHFLDGMRTYEDKMRCLGYIMLILRSWLSLCLFFFTPLEFFFLYQLVSKLCRRQGNKLEFLPFAWESRSLWCTVILTSVCSI